MIDGEKIRQESLSFERQKKHTHLAGRGAAAKQRGNDNFMQIVITRRAVVYQRHLLGFVIQIAPPRIYTLSLSLSCIFARPLYKPFAY